MCQGPINDAPSRPADLDSATNPEARVPAPAHQFPHLDHKVLRHLPPDRNFCHQGSAGPVDVQYTRDCCVGHCLEGNTVSVEYTHRITLRVEYWMHQSAQH